MKTGLYAGSFDPPTNGHLDMIAKGSHLFDSLIVGVGTNPSKRDKYTFTEDERISMVKACTKTMTNVTIVSLEQEYTVCTANLLGADFLLRGIRNVSDFETEQTLSSINKDWDRDIETVFLMPDARYREISSSIVRGLIGYDGWENKVRLYVPPSVLHQLQRKFWQSSGWAKLCQRMGAQGEFWTQGELLSYFMTILNSYWGPDRFYHNMFHILDCLNEFEQARGLAEFPDAVEMAIWLHDLVYSTKKGAENELASASLAFDKCTQLGIGGMSARVAQLILVTNHQTPPKTIDEELIVDIDLAILGQPWEKFLIYDEGIQNEYSHVPFKEYAAGRASIMKDFLARPYIYHTSYFRDHYEETARANIERLLEILSENNQ